MYKKLCVLFNNDSTFPIRIWPESSLSGAKKIFRYCNGYNKDFVMDVLSGSEYLQLDNEDGLVAKMLNY